MSGTIILIDGPAGCGKTTIACGMPEPRAMLETDYDGSLWVRDCFSEYEFCHDLAKTRQILMRWADHPKLASIVVDTHAYFWQQLSQHVLDDETRKRDFNTTNLFKAWGPAGISVQRLYDPYMRAKRAGKHVLLSSHTKEQLSQGDDMKVTKEGLRANCEPITRIGPIVDVHLRVHWNVKTDHRRIETIKCRPQRDWKPLLPKFIDIPDGESHLMYPRILELIGLTPEGNSVADTEADDVAALNAMQAASKVAAGGR